jgi:hypothetical protein
LTGRTPVDWTYMAPIFSHEMEKKSEKGKQIDVKSVESFIGKILLIGLICRQYSLVKYKN